MTPVRILHVVGALERGGVETWLLEMASRLDPGKWRFDFCTLAPEPGRYAAALERQGSRIFSCPRRPSLVACLARLAKLLRAQRYLLVHSHVHHFSALVLATARAAGVPVRLAHSHNTADGAGDRLARRSYRTVTRALLEPAATHAVACSAAAGEALFGPRRLFEVAPYGVSPDRFQSRSLEFARRLGVAAGAPVLGHVGRFVPQKNHAFLVEVAVAVARRRPQVRWLLVGDGPLRPQVEDHARRRGLGQIVGFLGLREDVSELLPIMDAFALPSWHEGLPVALLEAQAAGLRALVSDRVTREAAVVSGAVEFAPLEAGPAAWADRLLDLLDRPRLAAADAARQLAAAGCTLDSSLARLVDLYRRSLQGVA